MRINELIKELRTKDGMTQVDLAEKLNCNRQKIADWERGKSTPSADDIIALAGIFNVSSDYLLGLTNAATNDKDLQFVCEYTGLSKKSIEKLIDTRHYFKHNIAPGIGKKLLDIMDYILESNFIMLLSMDINDYNGAINDAIAKIERIEQRIKDPSLHRLGEGFEFFEMVEVEKELLFVLFTAQERLKNIIKDYSNDDYLELLEAEAAYDERYDKMTEEGEQYGDDQETE